MDQIIRNKDLSEDQVRSFISIDLEDQQVLSRIASILSSLQALGVGFRRENRPFSPHITIARVRSGRKRDEIANFLHHLIDESFGTITVEKVRLKQSILSSSGPKYSTLLEVPSQSP